MRYLLGLQLVAALGAATWIGCSESKQAEPDLEWPPNATAYFDGYGILHADCAFDEDCVMVLGYYHAANRFARMDTFRRFYSGRLSGWLQELIATAFTVDLDLMNRALFSTREGVPGGRALMEQASPQTITLFEAYSAGVNQWIEDVQNGEDGAVFPKEFENPLFTYGPDDVPEWTVEDCFSIIFGGLDADIDYEALQVAAGAARASIGDDAKFSDLWSRRPLGNSPGLPPTWTPSEPSDSSTKHSAGPTDAKKASPELPSDAGPALARLQERLQRVNDLRRSMLGGGPGGLSGSNSWAVGPSRSATGNALIANDPHTPMFQPHTNYLAHLDAKTHGAGTIHVAGFTQLGAPWIRFGQNEHIVWASTNAFFDLNDVYIEALVKDTDGNPTGVMFQGTEVPFTRVPFTVTFGDGGTQEHELLFVPHHGPVREIDVDNDVAITVRWAVQDASTDPEYLYPLYTATSVEETQAAFANVTAFADSRVVADTEGNIAWLPYARVPKRTWATNLDGPAPQWLPLDGRCATPDSCYEWTEYFTYEELPQLFNPEEGFVANSNNDMTGALSDGDPTTLPSGEFHPPYQVDVLAGYRRGRIVELIEEIDAEHSLDTMLRIQNDVYSALGRDMVPSIVSIAEDGQTGLSAEGRKVLNALKAWELTCPTGLDGIYTDSPLTTDPEQLREASGCAAFHATIAELCALIHQDDLGDPDDDDDDLVAWQGSDCPTYAAFYSIVDPDQLAAGDIYWDDTRTPETETKYQAMSEALDRVYDLFVNEKGLGTDEAKWAWGRLHGLQLISDFAPYPGGAQYNNPPSPPFFANAGGNHTVALAYPELDFLQGTGVSFRLACEVAPGGPSCNVQLAGGQSADVDSPNYDDLLRKLLVNEPIDLVFDIDRAKANAVRTVTFD